MAGLKSGPGLHRGVDVGPLVNREIRDKVARLVDDAVLKGAVVTTGGVMPEGAG